MHCEVSTTTSSKTALKPSPYIQSCMPMSHKASQESFTWLLLLSADHTLEQDLVFDQVKILAGSSVFSASHTSHARMVNIICTILMYT